MRDVLATTILLLYVFAMLWPEGAGDSIGKTAGKFMSGFERAYKLNRVAD